MDDMLVWGEDFFRERSALRWQVTVKEHIHGILGSTQAKLEAAAKYWSDGFSAFSR